MGIFQWENPMGTGGISSSPCWIVTRNATSNFKPLSWALSPHVRFTDLRIYGSQLGCIPWYLPAATLGPPRPWLPSNLPHGGRWRRCTNGHHAQPRHLGVKSQGDLSIDPTQWRFIVYSWGNHLYIWDFPLHGIQGLYNWNPNMMGIYVTPS
jgi:hypothetical protein